MRRVFAVFVLGLVTFSSGAALADDNTDILKQGLLGAGVGAVSAGASGGKAGKGALIGAGTNVIGGALLNTLMPSQPKPQPVQYVQAPPPQYAQAPDQTQSQQQVSEAQTSGGSQPRKHIIRKYDTAGNVVSEEEVWE